MNSAMRILFVSSGNRLNDVSPIIKNQADSLIRFGIAVEHFLIRGKGIIGYISNYKKIRQHMQRVDYDIIHAHYFYSAIPASFVLKKPVVTSLMGSELSKGILVLASILFFRKFFWKSCIVKSVEMKEKLLFKDAIVLPNGVDLDFFYPMNKMSCQKKLAWDPGRKHILFASSPERPEKNHQLASGAIKNLEATNICLHCLENIPSNRTNIYYNAADVVILTSLREGSPNVIKEAMACSRPIVATSVGDIKWLFGNEPGHYITDFNSSDAAKKIGEALGFSLVPGTTNGRNRLIQLGLDSKNVAMRIIEVYKKILREE